MLVSRLPLQRLARADEGWTLRPVEAPDGYALCRCGRSSTMPLCDRDEPYGCFDEAPSTAPEPSPFRWDVPEGPGLALKPDGPVRIAGPVSVTYGDEPRPPADRVSFCRCGASRCQPLCDSSHKATGFRADP